MVASKDHRPKGQRVPRCSPRCVVRITMDRNTGKEGTYELEFLRQSGH